jgi:hypothetical protein
MDECIILLILLIIVAALIVFSLGVIVTPALVGGAVVVTGGNMQSKSKITNDRNKQLFIGDYDKLVVDGHNMIHYISQSYMDIQEFENTLKTISKILTDAYPTQEIHIVIKNPSEAHINTFNKLNNSKKNNPDMVKKKGLKKKELKKSSEEHIPYFRDIVAISKNHPRITYHLAYRKESKSDINRKNHHLKGRDDFLTIYLARNGFMVSNDRFRDFRQFINIKAFKHYSVTNGSVHKKETIKPGQQYSMLEMPNLGNHFVFDIKDKKELDDINIRSGDIYLNNDTAFGRMYLARPNKD